MIHLKDISYVRLGTRDLAGASRYVHDILVLQTSLRSAIPKMGNRFAFAVTRASTRWPTLTVIRWITPQGLSCAHMLNCKPPQRSCKRWVTR